MTMGVTLTDEESAQFGRVNASRRDFAEASFCARYLLKRKWHCMPWERRGSIYNKQTAYVTNLVVAYARPFATGKRGPSPPIKHGKLFTKKDMQLHNDLLKRRDQIFAHSDSEIYSYWPLPFEKIYLTIEGTPIAVLSVAECTLILSMIGKMLIRLREKGYEIYRRAEARRNTTT